MYLPSSKQSLHPVFKTHICCESKVFYFELTFSNAKSLLTTLNLNVTILSPLHHSNRLLITSQFHFASLVFVIHQLEWSFGNINHKQTALLTLVSYSYLFLSKGLIIALDTNKPNKPFLNTTNTGHLISVKHTQCSLSISTWKKKSS